LPDLLGPRRRFCPLQLATIFEFLSIRVFSQDPDTPHHKVDWAKALVDWVSMAISMVEIYLHLYSFQHKSKPRISTISPIVKVATPAVMEQIHDVIRDTTTPSWFQSVPYNFSDPGAGTLKADEWHTMIMIYLHIALISSWGEGTSHISTDETTHLWHVLNHTMCLVSAVQLACMRTMTTSHTKAYHQYMVAWVSELTTLHPHATARPMGTWPSIYMTFCFFLVLFILGGAPLSSTSLGCFSIY
jgi:hypothetical protein